MSVAQEPGWWSWKDIVEHADRLGVPNFQRGAVWGGANRVALLESLYEQSPCGSFVFWEPVDRSDRARHGVALRTFSSPPEPIWLVDGQQRCRAMLRVFDQLLEMPLRGDGWWLVREDDLRSLRATTPVAASVTARPGRDEAEDHDGRFWGVVLPAMSVFDRGESAFFGDESDSRAVVRGQTFRRLQPGAADRARPGERPLPGQRVPLGVIPLAALLPSTGVFNNASLRFRAAAALSALHTDASDLRTLDELLPWGPQFITGYAFQLKTPDGYESPLSWSDIQAMDEPRVKQMTTRLLALLGDTWQPLVFERFRDMFAGNRFAFGWLPSHDVSEAIDAYVRINRSGIRVRAEEEALALLSRARPTLLEDLRAYFSLLPGGRQLLDDSREMLTHESDRQMGFGVWMRVLTRYTALALLGWSALRWLEAAAIDKDSFRYYLDRVHPDQKTSVRSMWARPSYHNADELVAECAERATKALLLVDSVLSAELHLDHRMARPSVRALMPMVDLLYRLPLVAFDHVAEDTDVRAAIARLLQLTMLSPYIDQADMEQLISACHGLERGGEANGNTRISPWPDEDSSWRDGLRVALGRYQGSLREIWVRRHRDAASKQGVSPLDFAGMSDASVLAVLALRVFAAELKESRSLQNPIVGWLYAIERRGNAREFDWQAQVEGFESTGGKTGVRRVPEVAGLRAELLRSPHASDVSGLYPEKQHIVPFADARGLADKRGTRATASPANAIGNLTWLSSRQNDLKALSDRWTVMDRDRDLGNLIARGMLAPAESGRSALDLYEELQAAKIAGSLAGKSELFTAFCLARTDWMVDQMRNWLNEPLTEGAKRWLAQ